MRPITNTIQQLRKYREDNGFPWFDAPWDLNVFVVRSETVGEWDDWLVVAGVDDFGREVLHGYQVTGEAWEGEWTEPTHPDGCIYVVDQHAAGAFQPGHHKGRNAMCQIADMEYVRWPKSEKRVPTVAELEALSGRFRANRGTHIHDRVSGRQPSKPQCDDSEGCIVFLRRPDRDHLLALVKLQKKFVNTSRISVTFVRAKHLPEA